MATASQPPPGDPPYQEAPNTSSNNDNARQIPEWMDTLGMHGQRIILSLRAVGNRSLPKNPFVIGKFIEQTCGKIESANTEQKGTQYVLKMRSITQAKKLTQMTQLSDGTEVEIIPHPTLNISRCVVSCREVIDLTEEELLNELAEQGIKNVRRITRLEGKNRINTPTLILTINGTEFPKYVMFGPLRIPTRTYYPAPMICYQCCSYGHTTKNCTSNKICKNCSGEHVEDEGKCSFAPYCKNCRGNHSPISRKCPLYVAEEKIIKMKVDSGLSFYEARKEYARLNANNTYAGVVNAQSRLSKIREENEKDKEIRQLKEQIAKMREVATETYKDKEIQMLRRELDRMKDMLKEVHNSRLESGDKRKDSAKATYPNVSDASQGPLAKSTLDIGEINGTKSPKQKKAKTILEISSDEKFKSPSLTASNQPAKRKTGRSKKTKPAASKETIDDEETSEMETA